MPLKPIALCEATQSIATAKDSRRAAKLRALKGEGGVKKSKFAPATKKNGADSSSSSGILGKDPIAARKSKDALRRLLREYETGCGDVGDKDYYPDGHTYRDETYDDDEDIDNVKAFDDD
jgi:hypothetical protein